MTTFFSSDWFTKSEENEFNKKKVCDLGCSAGVLGILALVNDAARVDFQDFVRKLEPKLGEISINTNFSLE